MNVSDRAQVSVRQLDHAMSVQLPDGTTGRLGYRLSELLEMFGGYEGAMRHPTADQDVVVSLKQWREADPESTFLVTIQG